MTTPYKSNAGLGFGLYEKLPTPPDGWRFIQSPHDWLLAADSTGRVFYVDFPAGKLPSQCEFSDLIIGERKRATKWDRIRTFGRLRVGQVYRAGK